MISTRCNFNILGSCRKNSSARNFREQTDDLANLKHSDFPLLATFLQFMQGEVREWLIRLSKMELDAKVALTGSRYSACDHLLPHDDRLERRAFAFAFYLTPGWKDSNGGELCLFDMDKESGEIFVSKFTTNDRY
jgi:Rps23 Pro-64 3,4-dihydroxylase Tpa1-like proline 4-hydroxylase